MRAVLQRVTSSNVKVNSHIVGEIEKGIVMLLGMENSDDTSAMKYILDKTIFLRIFEDGDEKMNLSLADISGSLLIVPNFTLYGDARKGRRPGFSSGASPNIAENIFKEFIELSKTYGVNIETGIFQADMELNIKNDGPVTILLDSNKLF